jgi:hypothetical protein
MDDALLDGAFFIGGHGKEHSDMIVVPDNCIIIVHAQYGEKTLRKNNLEILKKLYQLKAGGRSDVLHDPLKHIPTLLEIYGTLAIYQAGEQCPNFNYYLFDCLKPTECYNVPVGVINLDTLSKPSQYLFKNTLRNSATPSQIIDHFSRPYQDSIYPTKKDIEDTVKEVIAQSNAHSNTQTPSLRKIYKEIEKKIRVRLSDILEVRKDDFRKRVYYHSMCRSKKDVTEGLRRRHFTDIIEIPDIKPRPLKSILTLYNDIKQIQRLPPSISHTLKKASNAIALRRGMINALTHRIGETAKHRTPHIKTWMNSPVYQERRRKEVKQEIAKINKFIPYYQQRLEQIKEAIEKKEKKEKGINTSSDTFTTDMHTPIDTLKELERKFTRDIQRNEAMRDNLEEWERSMDAPLPPPISYVQESNAESSAESRAESNAESKSLAYLNHAVLPVRGSANDREQLQRMREAHARFKKGRNEYMEEANSKSNDYEKNMAYMTNEMKGYERGIKQLEYLTNVVPPFHTSRVKIDKNKQLQTMRNAHARFTSSRKKYTEDKASASDTHQYKKNMNYFNRILRDYEKGIHQAEQPSNSYTRVNRNGTVKWIRK